MYHGKSNDGKTEVVGLSSKDLDITDRDAVRRMLGLPGYPEENEEQNEDHGNESD